MTIQTENVLVDADKLAEGLRRVTPFMTRNDRAALMGVYLESHNGKVCLTTTDGVRLAHLELALEFPEGDWILDGTAARDFATTYHQGAKLPVEVAPVLDARGKSVGGQCLKIGEALIPIIQGTFPDYRNLRPQSFETMVVVATRAWIKAIRAHKAELGGDIRMGVVVSQAGCHLLWASRDETLSDEELPVQMVSGPEKKVILEPEYLRRALTSCGKEATIKLAETIAPLLFEAGSYWHLLMPVMVGEFPKEVIFTKAEKEALDWAVETIQEVRRGKVVARVEVGGGRFVLELDPKREKTEIVVGQ